MIVNLTWSEGLSLKGHKRDSDWSLIDIDERRVESCHLIGSPLWNSSSDQTTDINRDNGPKIRVENQDGDRTKDIDVVRSISADGLNKDASFKVCLLL